jgi:hypothetical protein
MTALSLFTWNLDHQQGAHDLALGHLTKSAQSGLLVACLQELPGTSTLAEARAKAQPVSPPTTEGPTFAGIAGTQGPTRWRGRGSSPCPSTAGARAWRDALAA